MRQVLENNLNIAELMALKRMIKFEPLDLKQLIEKYNNDEDLKNEEIVYLEHYVKGYSLYLVNYKKVIIRDEEAKTKNLKLFNPVLK